MDDPGRSRRGPGIESLPSFLGWKVVAVMFLATMTVLGATIYGFIVIAGPLAKSHGWAAGEGGGLVSAMWLVAPVALLCASLIGRIGPWRLLTTGLVVVAGAFAALTLATEFWHIYLLRTLMGAGKIFVLIPIPVIISRWFTSRFAMAVAIAWCGGAFGGLIFAPMTEIIIFSAGWKLAALALACALLLTAFLVALLERLAAPYGDDAGATGPTSVTSVRSALRQDRLRTISVATAGTMAFAVVTSGIAALSLLIQVPVLLEAFGFSAVTAATLLGLVAAGGMAGNLIAGWALDRSKASWTSIGAGAAIGGGLLAFSRLEAGPELLLAILATTLVGAGIGACEILWITLTKRQFGTELYAVTYGGWSFSYQSGYAMAGAVGGIIFGATSHTGYLAAIALLFVPAIAFSLWRPHMRNEESGTEAKDVGALA